MKEKKRLPGFEEWPEDFAEFLDDGLSLNDLLGPEEHGETGDTLASSLGSRLSVLRDALEEIDTEIGLRSAVSEVFQISLRELRREVSRLLMEIEHFSPGYRPSVDSRRTALERELLSLYREARAEKRQAFSDLLSLKRERRKLEMEYKTLKATAEVLESGVLGRGEKK